MLAAACTALASSSLQPVLESQILVPHAQLSELADEPFVIVQGDSAEIKANSKLVLNIKNKRFVKTLEPLPRFFVNWA